MDTVPPVLTLPADISTTSTAVTWTVSANDAIDGNVPVTCDPASGSTFAIGTTNVDCSATDPFGNTVSGRFHVTVQDTTAPAINASAAPAVLWPPNHKLVTVAVSPHAVDLVDPAPACAIVSATSSEPDNGLDDGDTANDVQITGALTAALRAERAGNGPGRRYTIVLRCRDAAGNLSTGSVTVAVPIAAK